MQMNIWQSPANVKVINQTNNRFIFICLGFQESSTADDKDIIDRQID